MIRFIGRVLFLLIVIGVILWLVGTLKSKATLKNEIIRLHIIANSNSEADQAEKIKVRDGILSHIQDEIAKLPSREEAENYIRTKLTEIEEIANQILKDSGSEHTARVKLGLKEFGKRIYETFTLPAGVYKALQIEIGEAQGENWWCVVFPGLCTQISGNEFVQTATAAGFDETVVEAISNDGDFKIRFFVLDFWGKIENFLFKQ